jgi:hypothetical protein
MVRLMGAVFCMPSMDDESNLAGDTRLPSW